MNQNPQDTRTFPGATQPSASAPRNPPIRFGAPRFAAARFTVTSDANQQQIRMRYIF